MSKHEKIRLNKEIYTEVTTVAKEHKQSPDEFITKAVKKYLEKLKREAGEK